MDNENTVDFAKLFEGINLAATEVSAKEAELVSLKSRLVVLAQQYHNLRKECESAEKQLDTARNGPSAEERAKGMATAMFGAGMTEAVIRAAILSQFGAKKVGGGSVSSSSSSSSGANGKDRLCTSGLPPQAAQDSILAAIKAAGAEGIRCEELRIKFQGESWCDAKNLALVTTMRNAIIKGQLRWEGSTRGRKYFAMSAEKPADSPAPVSTANVENAEPTEENTAPVVS